MYLNLQVRFELEYGFEHWHIASHCSTVNSGFTSSLGINLYKKSYQ